MSAFFYKRLFLSCLFMAGAFCFCQESIPGYFQQEVNFRIDVRLNDSTHELSAFESVQYINNSEDTLSFLYFHLWPNGYLNNSTALARQLMERDGQQKLFRDEYRKGFIDSLDFRTGNSRIAWNYSEGSCDICILHLPEVLKPGDTILITTPFHVKIPGGSSSRMGHNGQSYQISQWYPKPAVYDNHGWHPMPYLDQGEFYSEFGSFDVHITLPGDYTVAATGELQNADEIARLDSISSDSSWIYGRPVALTMAQFQEKSLKTLIYKRSGIHDFAWFADKQFRVLKNKISLPVSGKSVTTYLFFFDRQRLLLINAPGYVRRAILSFSEWIGDYPYDSYTVVQADLAAGQGMEYPGLAEVGYEEDPYSLDEVIAHEVCHNWFYSSLGSDERRFPFMDESITSAYEMRYTQLYYPDKKLWEVYLKNRRLAKFFDIMDLPVQRMSEFEWLMISRDNLDQRIDLPAPCFTDLNYTNIIYYKAPQGFNHLREYLGNQIFDSIMHEYYLTWGSKHPYPEDLRRIFESNTGKDLGWFFDDFIQTLKRADYKVTGLKGNDLTIKNKGELVAPVSFSVLSKDSVMKQLWSDGFTGRKTLHIPENDYYRIKVNSTHSLPELYYQNNYIRRTGLFRRAAPFHLQLIYSFDDPERMTVAYAPLLNWNRADGVMAGLDLNNGFLMPKNIEYTILPFYSFKKNELTGQGRIAYNFLPYNNVIRKATISFEGSHFGVTGSKSYTMTKTGIDLYFRNQDMRNGYQHKLWGKFITASDLFQITEQAEKAGTELFWQLGYVLDKPSYLRPFRLNTSIETGDSYVKSSAEFNYGLSYYGKNNGLEMRIFGGAMLENNSSYPLYNFAPSGRSGRELHFYQGEFPDRFATFPETFWSRQMIITEGGIASPINDSTGFSLWILSASFSSVLPAASGKIPVMPFLNMVYDNKSKFYCEAGFRAGIRNIFEFYVPLLVSSDISSVRHSVKERIRFIFNIDAIRLFKAPSERKD